MPRLPEYLKRPIIDTETTKTVRRILKTKCLNTVCEGARCPNKSECYSHNTATFLIMGQVCTRNCRYCNISPARPELLDRQEPEHIAEAVKELGLKYAVITSVTRDDLPDGGAEHFKNCIDEIRDFLKNMIDSKNRIINLDVTLAYEPDENMKEYIKQRLENKFQSTAIINYKKDESLLGGMQIKIKDTVIDLSIKSKLENFKRM